MAKKKVLLAGESWTSAATHIKGFDQFASISFHLGAEPLLAALAGSKFDLTYMKAHEAATDFPLTLDALDAYSVVILSDLGSNTLLLHPDVWFRGQTVPNRLKLLREWVGRGGALMMIGGYYSFQGINGGARYHKTAGRGGPARRLPRLRRPGRGSRGLSAGAGQARARDPRRARRQVAARCSASTR